METRPDQKQGALRAASWFSPRAARLPDTKQGGWLLLARSLPGTMQCVSCVSWHLYLLLVAAIHAVRAAVDHVFPLLCHVPLYGHSVVYFPHPVGGRNFQVWSRFGWHFKHFFVVRFGALADVFLMEWNGNCSTVFQMGCTGFMSTARWETSEVSESTHRAAPREVGLSMCVHQDLHQELLSSWNSGHLVENRTKDVNRHCTVSNPLISCPVINMWRVLRLITHQGNAS